MPLPVPPPIRLPLSWDYNSRSPTAPQQNIDARRVNVIDEKKPDGSGTYTIKRPGLISTFFFRDGLGQALTFYNGAFYAVTDDYLQATSVVPTGTNGAAWSTGAVASWAKRTYQQAVVMQNIMYVIGGLVEGVGASADVWWSPDGLQWTQATGSAPFAGRYNFAATVQNNLIYVMGGATFLGPADNQVWSSPDGTNWIAETEAAEWDARVGLATVATSNGIFIMGGLKTGPTELDDIWFSKDGKVWTEIDGGTHWSARHDMLAWYHNNKIFIAGGAIGSGAGLNDCWSSSDGGQTWTQLTAAAFSVGGLSLAGAVVYQNQMWAIGGRVSAGVPSDHVYTSTDGITWVDVTSNGPGPAVQGGSAVVFKAVNSDYQSMWFMGGVSAGPVYNHTTYYGTMNVTPSTAINLSPPIPDQQFQFASFVEGQKLLVKNPNALWVYDQGILTRVTDLAYPPTTVPGIVVLGAYGYVMDETGLIRNSLIDDPYHWPSLNAVGADYADDPGMALAKYQNYVVAFGTYTTQFFYDAGRSPGSPLLPYLNSNMLVGLADAKTLAEIGNTLVFVSQTRQLHRQVVYLQGTTPQVISTPFIEKMIGNSFFLSAVGASIEGHLFYILSIGDSLPSFVYDFSTKNWYEWSTAVTQVTSTEGAFNFAAFATSFTAVGTYLLNHDGGEMFRLNSTLYSDNFVAFNVKLITDKIDAGNNRTKFFGQLEVIGDRQAGQMIGIEYSDDDYVTWSPVRTVNMGDPRPVLYRNGKARRRAYRLSNLDINPMRLEALEQTVEQGE